MISSARVTIFLASIKHFTIFGYNHDVSLVTEIMYQKRLTELSKIVGPIGPSDKILTTSDLNYFTSDPMSGAIFQ
jgi:hypothetical protein